MEVDIHQTTKLHKSHLGLSVLQWLYSIIYSFIGALYNFLHEKPWHFPGESIILCYIVTFILCSFLLSGGHDSVNS